MDLEKNKVAIVTTVANFDLYNKTINFFPSGIKIYFIDGTKGFYGIRSLLFLIEKFKKSDIDWLIMADEDVVFKKPEYVFDLISYMKANSYTTCGMRDGGTLQWRGENPYSINTFFSILNLKEIYTIYNRKNILANQYIDKTENLGTLNGLNSNNYKTESLFEPYYCFYFWLLRNNKKILYLDVTTPGKDETTLVFDHEGRELLYHAWYSRFYNIESKHTARINKVLKFGVNPSTEKRNPILLKNPSFHFKLFFYTYSQRLKRLLLRKKN